jgi:type VI secretion system secreted protein Hcp
MEAEMPIFLKLDGIEGDSTDASHVGWFEVDNFSFGVTTPTNGTTGGASGRSHFTPLAVDIHSITGLAALLGAELDHHTFKSVELVETTNGAKEQTIFDVKLTNVTLADIVNAPGSQGPEESLSLNYGKISVTYHPQNSDGSGPPQTFTSNVPSTLPPSVVHQAEVTPVPQGPVHYFLKIDGVTGDSTDAAHKGWFTVDGFDFGATTPTSAGSGLPTGRSHVSPLLVDIHSVTGLAALLGDEVTNRAIHSIELVGVASGEKEQQTVYDLKLTNVHLDSLHNEPGAQGVEADLAFNFQRGSLTQGETTQTFGSSGGVTLPAVQDTGVTAVPGSSPVHYFLKVAGVTGDSTDAVHPGWFTVDGFDFGVATPTGASGAATGRTHISPLLVDIHSITGLAALLGDEVANRVIKSVELVGVESGGKEQQTIYDLTLTNVQLDGLHNAPGAQGVEADLAFNFQKGSLTQGETTQAFGSSRGAAATPAAQDTEVTAVPASSPVHYFLKVDGVTGDSTDKAHAGWFSVDGFDFGITTPTSAGSGQATGRSHISPLSVDIHSVTGLAGLLGDEVTNRAIHSIELVGVASGEKEQQTVYDLKLTNVHLDSLHNEAGAQGVEADLAFNFQRGSLTQGETTQTFGASSGPATPAPAQDTDVATVPALSPVHYFLKVAGVTGDSTDAAHPGWFTVDGFDFGITTPTGAASGQGTGRPHISPLSVDIHSTTGLAALFGDEVTNRTLASIELVGVESGREEQQTVYDLKLTNVHLDSLHNEPGAQGVETDLAFNFQRGSLMQGDTTQTFGASSSTAASLTAAQDAGATPVPASGPLEYFLKIAGVTGDSTDAAHVGWFDVDGFGFGVTSPTIAGTSAHAGRSHFSPLTVDIQSLTGVTALFADEVSHRLIRSAELVAVENGQGIQQTVYDLKLTNVTIASLHTAPGAQGGIETELALNFTRASVTDPASTPPTATAQPIVPVQHDVLPHDHGWLV